MTEALEILVFVENSSTQAGWSIAAAAKAYRQCPHLAILGPILSPICKLVKKGIRLDSSLLGSNPIEVGDVMSVTHHFCGNGNGQCDGR